MYYDNTSTDLQPYLERDEHLLWSAQPKTGIVFRPADIFMIPFSLVWCGFSIFWVTMAARASILFALFGVPFVIIGLIFVFGRFIIDAKQRANTLYGLTADRIIIRSGIFSKTIQSVNLRALPNIEYNEKPDGSGTIVLGSKNPLTTQMNGMNWWPGVKGAVTPSLEMIPEVRKVYNQIINLQKQSA